MFVSSLWGSMESVSSFSFYCLSLVTCTALFPFHFHVCRWVVVCICVSVSLHGCVDRCVCLCLQMWLAHGRLRLTSGIIFMHTMEALQAQHCLNVEEEHVWFALVTCCWDHGGTLFFASWVETRKALQKTKHPTA